MRVHIFLLAQILIIICGFPFIFEEFSIEIRDLAPTRHLSEREQVIYLTMNNAEKSKETKDTLVGQEDDNGSYTSEKDNCGSASFEDDEMYNPHEPNLYQPTSVIPPVGTAVTSRGQSEVITSAGGRRFVAQFYEETTDVNPNGNHANQTNPVSQGSQMAKALCVNLLTELVKGSYQMLKANTPEEEPATYALKEKVTEHYARMQDRIDNVMNTMDSDESDGESVSGINSSVDKKTNHEQIKENTPNDEATLGETSFSVDSNKFKKAKHKYEIKRTNRDEDEEGTSISAAHSVSDDANRRKRLTPAYSQDSSDEKTHGPLAKKKQKLNMEQQVRSFDENEMNFNCASTSNSHNRKTTDLVHNEALTDPSTSHQNYDQLKEESLKLLTDMKNDCEKRVQRDNNFSTQSSDIISTSTELNREAAENAEREDDEPELTYLEKWQNHHIAKAIVDNAINRTLDEMDLGPPARSGQSSRSGYFATQRQRIEDAGVSQAISQRGLQRQPPPLQQTDQLALNPFISQLTEVTEDIFVETLRAGTRFSASFNLSATTSQSPRTQNHENQDIARGSIQDYTLTHERGGHGLPQSSAESNDRKQLDKKSDKTENGISGGGNDKESTEGCSQYGLNVQLNSSHICEASSSQSGKGKTKSKLVSTENSSGSEDVFDKAMELVIQDKGLKYG